MNLEFTNNAGHIETFTCVKADEAFIAVVEANEKDPRTFESPLQLAQLLTQAASQLGSYSFDSQVPVNFASEVERVLLDWKSRGLGPGVVLYTGLLVLPDVVHVCSAGDIRVHLVVDGLLKAITRHHNYIDDPVPDAQVSEAAIEVYGAAPTRSLGVCSMRPPESFHWEVKGKAKVVICTSNCIATSSRKLT